MSHYTKLIICALLQCIPLSAMDQERNPAPLPSLDVQLCAAIHDNNVTEVPKLLLNGAKVKIKAKKN